MVRQKGQQSQWCRHSFAQNQPQESGQLLDTWKSVSSDFLKKQKFSVFSWEVTKLGTHLTWRKGAKTRLLVAGSGCLLRAGQHLSKPSVLG